MPDKVQPQSDTMRLTDAGMYLMETFDLSIEDAVRHVQNILNNGGVLTLESLNAEIIGMTIN